MTRLDSSKLPVKYLNALFWAEWHMKEARAACVHICELGEIKPELRHALFTGVVVSYARPFCENQGLPQLGPKYRKFPSRAAVVLHEALLEARDLIYAHNDRVANPKRLSSAASPALLKNVGIKLHANGRASWSVARAGFAEKQANEIGALCEFQIDRINKESTAMLQKFSSGRSYEPGEYTLGVDFP